MIAPIVFVALAFALTLAPARAANHMLIYIGTTPTAKNDARGIYTLGLDAESGKLSTPTLAAEAKRPSFLAAHPTRPLLYACSEVNDFEGRKSGGVEAFSFDPASAALTPINSQPSGGMGPCFVEVDPAGRFVVVANYSSGAVALLPINEQTGELAAPVSTIQHKGAGPNEKRQEGPHAHSIRVDPSGRFALAADLGIDQVLIYRVDQARLQANVPPSASLAPGAGPRHLAFAGNFVYVVNELDNTVTAFAFDPAAGSLRQIQTITTLPDGFTDTNYCAEIAVHPNGRFLYASNRGHDSIAVFSIDASTGQLTAQGQTSTQGAWPRHFALDPTGRWLLAANQNSNTLVLFAVAPDTGQLTPTDQSVEVPAPTCVRFIPR